MRYLCELGSINASFFAYLIVLCAQKLIFWQKTLFLASILASTFYDESLTKKALQGFSSKCFFYAMKIQIVPNPFVFLLSEFNILKYNILGKMAGKSLGGKYKYWCEGKPSNNYAYCDGGSCKKKIESPSSLCRLLYKHTFILLKIFAYKRRII